MMTGMRYSIPELIDPICVDCAAVDCAFVEKWDHPQSPHASHHRRDGKGFKLRDVKYRMDLKRCRQLEPAYLFTTGWRN